MSVYVLGCRQGTAVLSTLDVFERMMPATERTVASLAAAANAGQIDGALRVASASHLTSWGLTWYEAMFKCGPEVRAGLENCWKTGVKAYMALVSTAVTAGNMTQVLARVSELKMFHGNTDEQVLAACGAAQVIFTLSSAHSQVITDCDTGTVFGGLLTLLRRVRHGKIRTVTSSEGKTKTNTKTKTTNKTTIETLLCTILVRLVERRPDNA